MDRKLEDVVQALQFGKCSRRKCSVLIGAGCSVSAGIPSASGFVDLIRKEFEGAYERANPKPTRAAWRNSPPAFSAI